MYLIMIIPLSLQSQLDGVKDGLENMRSAVNELNQVRDGLEDVKTSYKSVETLYTVLKVSLVVRCRIVQTKRKLTAWREVKRRQPNYVGLKLGVQSFLRW